MFSKNARRSDYPVSLLESPTPREQPANMNMQRCRWCQVQEEDIITKDAFAIHWHIWCNHKGKKVCGENRTSHYDSHPKPVKERRTVKEPTMEDVAPPREAFAVKMKMSQKQRKKAAKAVATPNI